MNNSTVSTIDRQYFIEQHSVADDINDHICGIVLDPKSFPDAGTDKPIPHGDYNKAMIRKLRDIDNDPMPYTIFDFISYHLRVSQDQMAWLHGMNALIEENKAYFATEEAWVWVFTQELIESTLQMLPSEKRIKSIDAKRVYFGD